MQMCSHYLVDRVACTPASGWEKGQVENQVGLVRERFFTPRLRFKTLDELNAWLLDKCIAYAKVHRHRTHSTLMSWVLAEYHRKLAKEARLAASPWLSEFLKRAEESFFVCKFVSTISIPDHLLHDAARTISHLAVFHVVAVPSPNC
jgi:hypothetical protein